MQWWGAVGFKKSPGRDFQSKSTARGTTWKAAAKQAPLFACGGWETISPEIGFTEHPLGEIWCILAKGVKNRMADIRCKKLKYL